MRYRVYLVHAEVEVFIRQMCNLDLRYATGAFAGTRDVAVGGCKIGKVYLDAMIGPRIVFMLSVAIYRSTQNLKIMFIKPSKNK